MHTILVPGKLVFEPPDKTKKHLAQSSWKKVAFVEFEGDIDLYYAFFIKKRYNIELNKNLRKPHLTLVNDSLKDLGGGYKTIEQIENTWDVVKNKWNGKSINVELDISPRTNAEHWWLRVTDECKKKLNEIRYELNLGESYFPFHVTIGYIPDKMEEIVINKNGTKKTIPIGDNIVRMEHSKYIHSLIKKGLIT